MPNAKIKIQLIEYFKLYCKNKFILKGIILKQF